MKHFGSLLLLLMVWCVAPAQPSLRSPLEIATDPNAAEGHVARLNAARHLSTHLDNAVAAALCSYLEQPIAQPDLQEEAWHQHATNEAAVRNELATVLGRDPSWRNGLAESLIRAAANTETSPVWRDYCLQHLGDLLPSLADEPARPVIALLWQSTQSRQPGLAGTALLALERNIGERIEPSALSDRALLLASSAEDPGTRLTALQIASDLKNPHAAPLARQWLNEREPLALRAAALHALAKAGQPDDHALLNTYAANPHPVLRRAARAALLSFTDQQIAPGD